MGDTLNISSNSEMVTFSEEKMNYIERGEVEHGDIVTDVGDVQEEIPRDTVDSILHALGSPGKFTILQCVLNYLYYTSFAFPILSMVFIGYQTPHTCAKLTNETEELVELGLDNDTTATFVYHQCSIDIVTNISGSVETLTSILCVNGNDYNGSRHISFVSEWDLVCEKKTGLTAMVHSIMVMGSVMGGFVIAGLSDRVGRKRVLIYSQYLLAASGIAAAFSPNIHVLIVLRFFIGFFQAGIVAVGWTLLVEGVVPGHRRYVVTLSGNVLNSNLAMFALCAWLMKDSSWRNLQLVTALVNINLLLAPFLLSESLRWLLTNMKYKEGLQVTKRAAKWNGRDFDTIRSIFINQIGDYDEVCIQVSTNSGHKRNRNIKHEKYSVIDILKHRSLLKTTIILFVLWITCNMTYFGLFLNSSSLSGDRHLNFFLLGVVDFAGDFCIYMFMDRIGRRFFCLSALAVTVTGLLTSSFLVAFGSTELTKTLTSGFVVFGKFGIGLVFSSVYIYTPELYPTNIRSAALGLCSSVANIGGIVAPYTSPLGDLIPWGPGVLFSVICVLSGMLVFLLPETRGKSLPETIDDMKREKELQIRT